MLRTLARALTISSRVQPTRIGTSLCRSVRKISRGVSDSTYPSTPTGEVQARTADVRQQRDGTGARSPAGEPAPVRARMKTAHTAAATRQAVAVSRSPAF
ncbi:hypothetical protein [Streptomyces sp. NPDC002845]